MRASPSPCTCWLPSRGSFPTIGSKGGCAKGHDTIWPIVLGPDNASGTTTFLAGSPGPARGDEGWISLFRSHESSAQTATDRDRLAVRGLGLMTCGGRRWQPMGRELSRQVLAPENSWGSQSL